MTSGSSGAENGADCILKEAVQDRNIAQYHVCQWQQICVTRVCNSSPQVNHARRHSGEGRRNRSARLAKLPFLGGKMMLRNRIPCAGACGRA